MVRQWTHGIHLQHRELSHWREGMLTRPQSQILFQCAAVCASLSLPVVVMTKSSCKGIFVWFSKFVNVCPPYVEGVILITLYYVILLTKPADNRVTIWLIKKLRSSPLKCCFILPLLLLDPFPTSSPSTSASSSHHFLSSFSSSLSQYYMQKIGLAGAEHFAYCTEVMKQIDPNWDIKFLKPSC